jgi:hypothetical protein
MSNMLPWVLRGWNALLIEADRIRFRALQKHAGRRSSVLAVRKLISCEPGHDLDSTLKKQAVPQDFDLLNVDIDGNDYWVWKGLAARPKVVSIEYNSNFEPHERRMIDYEPTFRWQGDSYYGASALALAELGIAKGYVLVRHVPQTNLFFVRGDLDSGFPPLPVEKIEKQPIHEPSPRWMDAPAHPLDER